MTDATANRLERLESRLEHWLDDVEYMRSELKRLRFSLMVRGEICAAWRLCELRAFLKVTAREMREARTER